MHRPSLKSMTGFAQARVEQNGWALRVSLRSVNHRFLDLHLHLPEGFEPLEPRIRQKLRERIRRGHVDLTLQFEPAGRNAVAVNREVAAAYLEAAESLRRQFGVRSEPDVAAILRLPGVIASPGFPFATELERLEQLMGQCLEEALGHLDRMRQAEGLALAEEMSRRLREIVLHASRIEELADRALPVRARRLEARLKELLHGVPLDPVRLAQEAAVAAERSDTAEELARLRSHIRQFQELLSGADEIGKKLDFLLQEMQREANTLLSKTTGSELEGLEITKLALEVKSEIERLREQAQNIE